MIWCESASEAARRASSRCCSSAGASSSSGVGYVRSELVALPLALGVLRGLAAEQLGALGDPGGGLVAGMDFPAVDLAREREVAFTAEDRAMHYAVDRDRPILADAGGDLEARVRLDRR